MRTRSPEVVSSALLFILVAGGLHPAPAAAEASAPSLVIAEFYPCAVGGDEYLVLSNRGAEAVNLLGWTLSDGEGSLAFAAGTVQPGCTLSVSENASSFASAYGAPPDLEVPGWSCADGVEASGVFRMADAGDALELRSPDGSLADAVAYGSAAPPVGGWSGAPVPALRPGEVVRRAPLDAEDTDTSSDWTHFREYRYGYSDRGVMSSSVPAGRLTCFASPDCSLEVVAGVISAAEVSIQLCSYELSSPTVCSLLSWACSRGVDVHVLVDSQPVGGMSAAQVACLSALVDSGADVRVVGGNMDEGQVRHIGALHAKYIVADRATLVVLSENFVEDGVPTDRLFGNRGWGVSVDDPASASWMSEVFDDDSRIGRSCVWQWSDDSRYLQGAGIPEPPVSAHPVGMLGPAVTTEAAEVSLFLSPDSSVGGPFLAPLVSGAGKVLFEQFQADLEWTTRWADGPVTSPVVQSVEDVVGAGGEARGLFDGLWYNAGPNMDVVDHLTAALPYGSESSFRLLAEESPVTVLHNKGLVLDGSAVVSSNNWVYASFSRNRELAVVVGSDEASGYFSEAFELDWVPDQVAPVADAGPDIEVPAGSPAVLDASGSWDDRAVANLSWDLDGDGRADAWGAEADVGVLAPGVHRFTLEVTDAWGNAATDSVEVTVGTPAPVRDPPLLAPADAMWPMPAAVSLMVVALAVARKLNLLRASTRGEG